MDASPPPTLCADTPRIVTPPPTASPPTASPPTASPPTASPPTASPPTLCTDIIAHMVTVAPWGALNSLTRTCRAAAIVTTAWADRFVVEVIINDESGAIVARELPNGIRHGITQARAAVMYSMGVPHYVHTRWPLPGGYVGFSYHILGSDIRTTMVMRGTVLARIELDQIGKKYVRCLTIHPRTYTGWIDGAMQHTTPAAYSSVHGDHPHVEWFASSPSWADAAAMAPMLFDELAGGAIEPRRRPQYNEPDPIFPGVMTPRSGRFTDSSWMQWSTDQSVSDGLPTEPTNP